MSFLREFTHRGYIGRFAYDAEARLYHGEVANTRAVLTFQGRTVAELCGAFRGTIEESLAWCAERGKEPEAPGATALERDGKKRGR